MYTCDDTAIWLGGVISASLHLARFSIDGCQVVCIVVLVSPGVCGCVSYSEQPGAAI